MSGFASYYDVYGPGGMADDRDDSEDPEFRDQGGYCEHGRYVGGCGIDYMCDWCESGISAAEMNRIFAQRRLAGVRERADRAEKFLALLLREHGTEVGGIDAADFAQRTSRVNNPLTRYGRH